MTDMKTSTRKPLIASRGDTQVRYLIEGTVPLGSGASGNVYLADRLPDGPRVSPPSTDDAEDSDLGTREPEVVVSADDARRVALKMTNILKWKGHLAAEAKLLHELGQSIPTVLRRSNTGVFRLCRIHSGPEPLQADDQYGSALIELEFLDGETLKSWFKATWRQKEDIGGAKLIDEVLTVATELGEALQQLHFGLEKPIIHRDVKPDNIMRTSRGLRLFDLNVSTETDEDTHTQYVGTPRYRAPEVEEGREYDRRADLYSLGVILWEVLHRRRFERGLETEDVGVGRVAKVDGSVLLGCTEGEVEGVTSLIKQLVAPANGRFKDAASVLEAVRTLQAGRAKPTGGVDPVGDLDMIGLLHELRPSGLVSVVTDTSGKVPRQALQDFLRDRMQVDDPLEAWLEREVASSAQSTDERPSLIVLAGNAGDGKSHLMYQLLRKRLAQQPALLGRINPIADATHALDPSATQQDRLSAFFAPFADDSSDAADTRVHLIAMNTGMVIRFFDGEAAGRWETLYGELSRQLGLKSANPSDAVDLPWRVQVVNLDLRDLLARDGANGMSFFDQMLARLDPEAEHSISAVRWADCQSCPALSLCPVAFNLRALTMPVVRASLSKTLLRSALETDNHLSPRNLWGFFYRLLTGGVERYQGRNAGEGACDYVRRQAEKNDGRWLMQGQFTELLFQQPNAGAPWRSLARHDPAYSSAPAVDHLHTRLSIRTELDNDQELLRELGGDGSTLAGLSLRTLTAGLPRGPEFRGERRDAAVRRQVLFSPEMFSDWERDQHAPHFAALLSAYGEYSRSVTTSESLSGATRAQLEGLKKLVRTVFVHGNGRTLGSDEYLRVSQPNARSASNELLVRASDQAMKKVFNVQKIVAPDVHILAHAGREDLLTLLGYRPRQVTLNVLGVRFMVDLAVYTFLLRVNDGQKPSVREMAQFQALLYIGERVGNALARETTELFVWDGSSGELHRLSADDFGTARMAIVAEALR